MVSVFDVTNRLKCSCRLQKILTFKEENKLQLKITVHNSARICDKTIDFFQSCFSQWLLPNLARNKLSVLKKKEKKSQMPEQFLCVT